MDPELVKMFVEKLEAAWKSNYELQLEVVELRKALAVIARAEALGMAEQLVRDDLDDLDEPEVIEEVPSLMS